METTYQVLRLFLSSPGDVQQERKLAENVVQDVSRTCKDTLGLHLEIIKWEDMLPMAPSEESVQEIINKEVRKCQVFVLVLNKRFGKPAPGFKKSNTEREIETALDLIKQHTKVKFHAYFREAPPSEDPGPQEEGVMKIKEKLKRRTGILYHSYSTPYTFQYAFTNHLYETALRFRHSTYKDYALRVFWQLGTPERHTSPRLAVLYPSFERPHISKPVVKDWWAKRLLPSMAFEDFKALQKIEKTLRLIGMRDFQFYSTTSPPVDLNYMNRVFICLPRNRVGQKYYETHTSRAKFRFTAPHPEKEARLLWRYGDNSFFEIRSPLTKYLTEQRRNMGVGSEWQKEMGQIVAKDFAVLGRLRNRREDPIMRDGYLHDFFIAGIRGLGTWGAAYSIDRKYKRFLDVGERKDIQFLLEVTYKKDRIFDVVDVSDKPQSYFKECNKITSIRHAIEEFRKGL